MALPQNRPYSANLTPDEMRQGIKRLEYRRSEVEGFNFGREDDDADIRFVAQPLHQRVASTLAKVFGDGTIEYIQYRRDLEFCWSALNDDTVEFIASYC